ncbi:single-stranded DNA-binding protein (plasmid) [Deinococcus radiomollis]|uniref:single-stranded DNA-binding protein n=1 Tax=Deinococcus radiomollis TaxID=468916 RepID=UPI0038926047
MRNLKSIVLGALASTLELVYSPNGTAIAKFIVAGSVPQVRADTGEVINIPFYTNVSLLGKGAENLAERKLQPGDAILVTGVPQYESWKNEVGVQRSTVSVRALNVEKVEGEFETVTDKGNFIRMIGGVNSHSFIGHLTADVVVKQTPSGDAVCNYRVGVSDNYNDRQGKLQERTHWFDCTAWREQAEAMAGAKKGQPVMVIEGALSRNSYVDKEGVTVNRRYFEVHSGALLVNRPKNENAVAARKGAAAPAPEVQYIPDDAPTDFIPGADEPAF